MAKCVHEIAAQKTDKKQSLVKKKTFDCVTDQNRATSTCTILDKSGSSFPERLLNEL